jgi:Ribosomal protein S6
MQGGLSSTSMALIGAFIRVVASPRSLNQSDSQLIPRCTIAAITHSSQAEEYEHRYHTQARWISTYFDSSPATLAKIDEDLKVQDCYLRSTTIKPVSSTYSSTLKSFT